MDSTWPWHDDALNGMTFGIVRGGDVKVSLGDKFDCYLRCMECLDWTLTEVTLAGDDGL